MRQLTFYIFIYIGLGLGSVIYTQSAFGLIVPFGLWFFSELSNIAISSSKVRLKLLKSDKYSERKSPIYKVIKDSHFTYKIQKFEQGWFDLNYPYFIPFVALFQEYRYGKVATTEQDYTEFDLQSVESLEEEFEKQYSLELARTEAKKKELQEKRSKVEKLNQEFYDNYI